MNVNLSTSVIDPVLSNRGASAYAAGRVNRSRTTSDRNGDSLNGPIQNPLPFPSPPLPYMYAKRKRLVKEAIHRRRIAESECTCTRSRPGRPASHFKPAPASPSEPWHSAPCPPRSSSVSSHSPLLSHTPHRPSSACVHTREPSSGPAYGPSPG